LGLFRPVRNGTPSATAGSRLATPRATSSLGEDARLSVVIVNYRHWLETAQLVRQLLESAGTQRADIEIIVVDNHSPNHPLIRRLRRWPGVSLRRWRRNRGFAQAANEGFRLSCGDWILLLNPDISVTGSFTADLLHLIARLPVEQPRTGVVGFHLRNPDGSEQLSSGNFPTLLGTVAGLRRCRAQRKYAQALGDVPRPVPWVTGCCFLVSRECFRQLNGFDEDFFLYYEDVDLCRRAQALGWSVWYEPSLRAVHHHPLHGRTVSPCARLVTRHALLTYGHKHWPRSHVRVLARLVRAEACLRSWWASACGDPAAARQLMELAALAFDLSRGRWRAARRRLDRVVRGEEQVCAS
jgi:GT2 family glycosyltransferase